MGWIDCKETLTEVMAIHISLSRQLYCKTTYILVICHTTMTHTRCERYASLFTLFCRKGQLATKRKEADLEILPRIINNRSRANKKQEPEIPADDDTSQVHYVTSVIVDDSPSCDDTAI